jgi:ABC-2 type transport system ATP-binding protein
MTMHIKARNVRLSYGDVAALDGLSVSLEGNRIIGPQGRNGSGKTSLFSAPAAFRQQDEGEILINGEPVSESAALTSQIALIREGGDVVDEDEPLAAVLAMIGAAIAGTMTWIYPRDVPLRAGSRSGSRHENVCFYR